MTPSRDTMTAGQESPSPDTCPICGEGRVRAYPTPYPVPLWYCADCRGRFVYPLPGEKDLEDRYEEEHRSGKWADLFDQTPMAETTRRAKRFAQIARGVGSTRTRPVPSLEGDHVSAEASPGTLGRLLDVGFGDGRFLDASAEAGWETWGMELSEAAARSVDGRHTVLVGDLTALEEGPRFDAITFWDVLEHVPDPAGMVGAAAKLLRPGGLIGATMPNVFGAESVVQGPRWKYYDLDLYGHLFHLAPEHLSRFFDRAGLATIEVETRGSVDLRDLLSQSGHSQGIRMGRWCLDRLSGLVARLAVPMGRGNTLMVVARASDANGA